MKDSPADTISHNRSSNCQRKSLSERSIIRSLDELFSEVTDIHNDISSNSGELNRSLCDGMLFGVVKSYCGPEVAEL